MSIQVNEDYIFTSRRTTDTIVMGTTVSDVIYDNHYDWSELNGKKVTVVSIKAVKSSYGCKDLVKVFISEEGPSWWFTAEADELGYCGSATTPTSGVCSCELKIVMLRGCQCGGS